MTKQNQNENKKTSQQYAAALQYQPGQDRAPRITATGRGDLARTIKSIAEKHNVPIYHDAQLAQTLYKLGANTEIPPELYEVIAQILVFITQLDQKS